MAVEDRVGPDPGASDHDAARESSRPRAIKRITDFFETSSRFVFAIGGLVTAAALLWAGINHFVPTGHASAATGPEAVVEDFYAAINKHDWLSVWSLGGKYLGHGPYKTLPGMIGGYHCTVRDTVKGLRLSGNSVSGYLVAHDSYGGLQTEQTYQFKYLVLRGAIRKANVKILLGRAPPGCA